jgi:uncharacterized protein (TIGR02266 family)
VKHRRHRRVAAQGIEAQVDAPETPEDCNIENISVGGLFLRTQTTMPLGMPVRVELAKPGLKRPLHVTGRVVSVVTEADARKHDIPPGVGIEFDPLPHETERRLHALLRDLGLKDLADPTPIAVSDLHGVASPDTQQVASNVRGLLEMLTDALQKVKDRDVEIMKLKDENRRLKAQLADARR